MAKGIATITADVDAFNRSLRDFGEKLVPEKQLLLQKTVALQFLKGVVEKNPVGNAGLWKSGVKPKGYVGGRSRANWQVGFNGFNTTEVKGIDPTGGATIGAGELEISSVSTPFKVIWVFNNVPYIGRLENGHSAQAPAGMVKLTLAEIGAGIRTL